MTSLRAIVTVAFALTLVGAGAAVAKPAPSVKDEEDKFVLANEDVTVWFQGKKPMLKVFPTSGGADAGFEFRFDRVVEFADANADGLAQDGEVRAFLNLDSAKAWTVETTSTETEATLALTLDAPLKLQGPAPVDLPDVPQDQLTGNVTLVFHVFADTVEVPGPNGTVPLDTTQVKYDLAVNAWSWIDAANDRLALIGRAPAELTAAGEGAATVTADGAAVGMVAWAPTAEATTDGATADVDVLTDVASADGEARIQHAFAASGYDSLLYDPVFGVASATDDVADEATGAADALNPVPGAGVLVAVGAVAAVAVAARRR